MEVRHASRAHKRQKSRISNAYCVFDVTPDGVPRGGAYIESLEAQVAALKDRLREAHSKLAQREPSLPMASHDDADSRILDAPSVDTNQRLNSDQSELDIRGDTTFGFTEVRLRAHATILITNMSVYYVLARPTKPESPNSDITPFNMLQAAPSSSGMEAPSTLPTLPSSQVASHLVEAAYLYTQARYCVVDWAQVHEWHRKREEICFAGTHDDDVESQIGAFFIWIVYAIGAQFSGNYENLSRSYFARARTYLPAVLSLQDMTTLQGLLALVQYSFRAPLVGIALRLCIELGYHRSATVTRGSRGPYHVELRKRFFWCAYSFDRFISYISKRPFGIAESDIDVEVPLEVDLTCTDDAVLHELQIRQAVGAGSQRAERTTTEMSSVLHQLRLDRVRSRIMTRFMAPGALPPSSDEVWRLRAELDQWRQQAPRKLPTPFPQHTNERVHATWLHVALLLLRPVLSQPVVDQDLLLECAILSAEACENAKALSLSPQTQPSPIQVYHCFNCGISLLQCLALQPTILAPRRIGRAIVACSSALAIYTRSLATASIFLELFDRLSDSFLGDDGDTRAPLCSDHSLRTILQDIIGSAPAEMPRILHSLRHDNRERPRSEEAEHGSFSFPDMNNEYIPQHLDFGAIGNNVFPTFDMGDLIEPFEMFYDMALLHDYEG
ncbi:fungal-specific transcription factor domain-containing protein [Aspergillus cavernicola]|uniref:Fungal-specific transcription factor domain-containing protein n=1 Tax=Aspergillus cavernicola TaxID=176166 RepID=A0ABR4I0L8_9EURO